MSIIIAVLVFGVIVVIHEFGHFITARKCGVLVEEFAIGMGPVLFSRKKGETVYSLRLFPIGGFCKMLGEDSDNYDERAVNSKSIPKRMLIFAGGAVMNVLLALAIFFFLVASNGYSTSIIKEVTPGTPAEKAGLMPGDRIVRMDGTNINIYEDLGLKLSTADGRPITVGYIRGGQRHKVDITPYEAEPGSYRLGFRADVRSGIFDEKKEGFERASIYETLTAPIYQMMFYVKITVVSLIKLITFQMPLNSLSGPIGIVTVINDTYTETIKESAWITFLSMLSLSGLLSANLGVFNLLPLPALDGGRIMFLIVEMVRRKPVPVEKEGMVHFIGFVLLMVFAVVIAFSDIGKLIPN